MSKFKFINNQKRSCLSEGRNKGFSSGFCKRNNKTFETIMPITACKDFLNEIVHSENTGKQWDVYGLHSERLNIFDKKAGYAYLACSILGTQGGKKHAEYDRDYKALKNNWKNVEKLLNYFEDKFKSKKKTRVFKQKENLYLFFVPLMWCEGTYLISLYGWLSRVAIFWDGKGSPMDFLTNFSADYGDKMMFNSIKPKLQRMIDGYIPKQNLDKTSCPHNIGIVTYRFPTEEDSKAQIQREKNGVAFLNKMVFSSE